MSDGFDGIGVQLAVDVVKVPRCAWGVGGDANDTNEGEAKKDGKATVSTGGRWPGMSGTELHTWTLSVLELGFPPLLVFCPFVRQ